MEANELRIGNLLMSNGNVVEVEGIRWDGIGHTINRYGDIEAAIPYADLEPIPLTEEWLIKFGFRNGTLKMYSKEVGQWRKRKCCIHWKKGKGFINSGGGVKINHVHQLQNLYFVLNGKELELR